MSSIWDLYKKVVYRIGIGDLQKWSNMPLSMVQMRVLIFLSVEQPVRIRTLAEHMNTSFPNMTGILKRLEHQDLVRRYTDMKDRRNTLIEATPKAMQMLEEALESGWQNLQFALKNMSETERETVYHAFELLEKNLPSAATPSVSKDENGI